MTKYEHMTDSAALAELGERVARHRLERNLTQAELAREAGISRRTLSRLEAGESTQLTNLVRVLRSLELLGNLDALVPPPIPSPLEQLRTKGRVRKRASPRSDQGPSTKPDEWTWGDGEEGNA
ncbi:MAG: XRE family transcriptional regulator [Phycisphaeraceae bacterium]|nr:MAG: XRE family transcriptional regulator [Phycisphaeraceae bacterium]